jgi:hypothetical protein
LVPGFRFGVPGFRVVPSFNGIPGFRGSRVPGFVTTRRLIGRDHDTEQDEDQASVANQVMPPHSVRNVIAGSTRTA